MNPITLAGGIAALAVAGYALHVAYVSGQGNVQAKWNADVIVRQTELSKYKDKLYSTQLSLEYLQKEARDAHEREKDVAQRALAVQRARSVTVNDRLRNTSDGLAKRFAADTQDSTALRECKATGTAYRSVFESCALRYRELGEDAQQRVADAVARGFECERTYDAAERSLRELNP